MRHEGWSLQNVPTTNSLALAHKWVGEENYLAPALLDTVLDVDHQDKWIVLKCQSYTAEKFIYSILMDSTSQFFSLAPLLTSLENTIFMPMIKDLEELQDQKFWEIAQGLPLRAKG
jgi:hypothetical protein